MLCGIRLMAQLPPGDSSYKTTYWVQKVTLFRLLPNTPGEIIFLGNSITDIGEWAEIWQNHRVKNRGISGDVCAGVFARLDEVCESRPSRIYLMIGINDIAKGLSPSSILEAHKKIYDYIKLYTPGTMLIVQSLLPTNDSFTAFIRHQQKTLQILEVNRLLEVECALRKICFVNLYPGFVNTTGKLNEKFTNDGLHVNGAGYIHWKQMLEASGLGIAPAIKKKK